MRVSVMAVAAAGLMLAGCGSVPSVPLPKAPWSKSEAMPTRASCPAMKGEQWKPVVDAAIHKTFDRELQKRFGDTAIHSRLGFSKTDKGDTIITAHRIGPAKYAMPEPDKGGQIDVIFKACTGEHLKTRKLADLERKPGPLAVAAPEGATVQQEQTTPRKRGFKWPWKS